MSQGGELTMSNEVQKNQSPSLAPTPGVLARSRGRLNLFQVIVTIKILSVCGQMISQAVKIIKGKMVSPPP